MSQASPDRRGAWRPDPSGRHDYRWFDGRWWTEAVSDRGLARIDPYPVDPSTGLDAAPAMAGSATDEPRRRDRDRRSPPASLARRRAAVLGAASVLLVVAAVVTVRVVRTDSGLDDGIFGTTDVVITPDTPFVTFTDEVTRGDAVRVRVELLEPDGTPAASTIDVGLAIATSPEADLAAAESLADLVDLGGIGGDPENFEHKPLAELFAEFDAAASLGALATLRGISGDDGFSAGAGRGESAAALILADGPLTVVVAAQVQVAGRELPGGGTIPAPTTTADTSAVDGSDGSGGIRLRVVIERRDAPVGENVLADLSAFREITRSDPFFDDEDFFSPTTTTG